MGSLSKLRAAEYRKYLESFPEEVYNLDPNSHLVRFLDALCDSGVGSLRTELLANRVATSLDETSGSNLDSFYGDLFGLKRLPDEEYTTDGTRHTSFTANTLLDGEKADIVKQKDAKYRQRIWNYVTALQAAGTISGIRRAAMAAFGCRCFVLESNDFYGSNSLSEDADIMGSSSEDWIAIHPPKWDGVADTARYDCVLIVVDKDDVTAQDRRYASSAISRLLPQDCVAKVLSRKQANALFALNPESEEVFTARAVDCSSSWWERTRYITGAEDWSYEYDPSKNFWVEPNVRKEAPLLVGVNSQEFVTDYTFMVDTATASSEHIGSYNTCQTEIYSVLNSSWALSSHPAIDALSSAYGKSFAISLDGEVQVIDGTYPIDYLPAVLPQYQEQEQGRRMWSSCEDTMDNPDEWIRFDFSKEIPLNRITLNAFAKPFKMRVYALMGGSWEPIARDGIEITYTCDGWRGDSVAGEGMQISFDFDTVMASAIRFTFERTQRQRIISNGDGTMRALEMVYSIDIYDVTFLYMCLQRGDFISSSYSDVFGNLVETELCEYPASNAISSDSSFWLSQPDIVPEAVEYLIFDVRDSNLSPQAIDFIEIDAILSGAQMNIYSAYEDTEGGHVWYPYSGTFTLKDGRYELEERVCSFIKLEFTNLSSIIYDVAASGIKVYYNLFPSYAYLSDSSTSGTSKTYTDELLETADTVNTSTASVSGRYLKTGLADIYAQLDTGDKLSEELATNNVVSYNDLWTVDAYRSNYSLGSNAKSEQPIGVTSQTPEWSFAVTPSRSTFPAESNHVYDRGEGERTTNIAYCVGIRSVSFGRSEGSTLYEADGVFFAKANDSRFTSNLYNMEDAGSNGISPIGDSLSVYESRDFDTTCSFDSFDFAVSMRDPQELFQNPSDMYGEWASLRDEDEYAIKRVDMGSSGTVARIARQGASYSGAEGVISESKMVRVEGVAQFSCRIYDYGQKGTKATWNIDCMDGDEVLYSMSYQVERGGWHTLNSVFQIEPAGGWVDSDYPFRCKLDIYSEGGMAKGESVFVPVLDMLSEGTVGSVSRRRVQGDLRNLKVVYYNGMVAREIDRVVTGNHEIWFPLQEDIPAGKHADGAKDRETRGFIGCYYLYYGKSGETGNPLNDECAVFDMHAVEQDAAGWHDDGQCSLDGAGGFICFDWTPDKTITVGSSSSLDGYLWRWESDDGSMRADMHVYQDTLVFDIYDGEFRSSCSGSFVDGQVVSGTTVRILGVYGAIGTASHGAQDDPARAMRLYISTGASSGTLLADTENIYDLKTYDNGTYRR